MQTKLLNTQGEEVGKVELRDDIFGLKPRKGLLHEFVTVYRANQREGTAHTKTRSEVSGGGKKPWKQKHTGRARAGSNRSPLWRKGGINFGPRKHSMRIEIPRRKARLALSQALSARAADGGLIFVDALSFEEGKTKAVAAMLKKLGCGDKTMLVLAEPKPGLTRASRNIPGVQVALASDLNAYTVLRSRKLVMVQGALEKLAGLSAQGKGNV